MTFYYDHATHWATSDEEGPIITVPGSVQSELGCTADWEPACMRPWLQDKDGDGVFALVHEDDPRRQLGVQGGVRAVLSPRATRRTTSPWRCPKDGARTTFLYDTVTHGVTITSEWRGAGDAGFSGR